ncbi:MAG: NAD(P)H-dependent oxidoreductase [Epsilonproteobacteria bacterium]|nr:NAD(P)H-dependent oxidoreductase [Campylobacterota bacterium]OIO16108.1 MAG: NAD(P)H-dependent oxidoreductase [Helicobacteraceae bacterium CG1_02_36_14]PIP10180.1 MAG: NAD(P)H-dependent oxidoreductase [Sulfurimonas sp. CG23_combo_of_CG06-09_8_20_14_all_36_33]PIS26500.1 MAG: NAD(P)H-dependent oxidoreductase [Sulfurimonas sp. CG08_land_8_20_14_0_20_36_33]PIU33962.1 MAG: NAD(P)H-dependent oxidoreductase [Sulfurimonas sp. CG07_land_8_20_14_0_80_36_56]PIV03790.1 MAG: NAD(P)H-dependent oxidoreduc
MRNDFEAAMHFRHACKLFDETKAMSQEDLNFILEAGRLSPSSFGMEQWHFFVIRDKAMREEIKKVAWNQAQVTTASELIAIVYKKQVRSSDAYIQSEFDKFHYPDGVRGMYKQFIDPREDAALESWSAKQVYIAAGNMMTAGASIGIDSCPMEGFDKDSVEKIIGLETEKYALALLVPFGYRVNEQPPLHRSELSEIVSYL